MRELSPKQVAQALGVSESSVKRWCDKGLIPAQRTQGGHRRLPVSGVVRFLRDRSYPVSSPEELGLPAGPPRASLGPATVAQVQWALSTGNEVAVERLLFGFFLGGVSVARLCDEVLSPAFHELGLRWEHGELEIYEERRAVEIALRFLHEVRAALPGPQEGAPLAFGATVAPDRYVLPTTMVDVVFRENGWSSQSLGTGHPVATLCAALARHRPRVMWLSVSDVVDREAFLVAYQSLWERAEHFGTSLVTGGRALASDLLESMQGAIYCENMLGLTQWLQEIGPRFHQGVIRDAPGGNAARPSSTHG